MITKKIRLCVILLFFILNYSCDNLTSTESDSPGISVYKTKGDYFNLITVGMKGDQIFRTYNYWNANITFERME